MAALDHDQLDVLLDEAARSEMTLREALGFLVSREIARRDERRISMASKIAQFPFVRELDGFDWSAQPSPDQRDPAMPAVGKNDPDPADPPSRSGCADHKPLPEAILNRCGKRTGKGNTWTESRVRSHRSAHGIAVYRDGEMAERGELTLEETARCLMVSKMTVLRLINSGVIPARQACKGAPWAIPEAELVGLDARAAFLHRPQPEDTDQQSLMLQ